LRYETQKAQASYGCALGAIVFNLEQEAIVLVTPSAEVIALQ
jgi:hypothetical protein